MFEEWLTRAPLSERVAWFSVLHVVGEACGAKLSSTIGEKLKLEPNATGLVGISLTTSALMRNTYKLRTAE